MHGNWGEKRLLEGNLVITMLLSPFCLILTANLHALSLHLFALKWSPLPLHSSHWHNILCAILNPHKFNVHLMHLSRSYCEKTNTPKPKQTRLCKQISSSSARQSGLFLLSVIDRLLQRWWLHVKYSRNISRPGYCTFFFTATCAIHLMFLCTFLIFLFHFVWKLFHLPLPSHYL